MEIQVSGLSIPFCRNAMIFLLVATVGSPFYLRIIGKIQKCSCFDFYLTGINPTKLIFTFFKGELEPQIQQHLFIIPYNWLGSWSSPEPFYCDSPNNCTKDMITYDIDGYLKNDGLSMPLVCPIFLFYLCNHQRALSVIQALS